MGPVSDHVDKIVFEHGTPSYHGDKVVKCFAGNNNGLLFRIINQQECRWAFYNDTTNYVMTVHVSFGQYSNVEPLMHTQMVHNSATAEYDFQVTVRPGETEMFMEGEPDGYRISFEAQRISKKDGKLKPAEVVMGQSSKSKGAEYENDYFYYV